LKKWIALALVLAWLAVAALAEGRVTTTEPTDLRKGPGTDYRIIGAVEEGARLSYDRTAQDAGDTVWYRVRVGGRTGWISALSAGPDVATGDELVTTTSDAKLRSGPGPEYASRLVIEAGTTLEYDGIAEDDDDVLWYRVSYSGKRGWISSRVARPGADGITGSVTTLGDAKLRSGAGEGYGARTVVPGGVALDYDRTETDGQGVVWYRVHYGARRGWLSSLDVRRDGDGFATGNRVRTTGIVHLRSGPDRDSASVVAIREGVTLACDRKETDDRGETWYHVHYNGQKGWISSRYAEEE